MHLWAVAGSGRQDVSSEAARPVYRLLCLVITRTITATTTQAISAVSYSRFFCTTFWDIHSFPTLGLVAQLFDVCYVC